MLKKVKLSKKGFTLVELLAVIVIMGILMMIAIPSISRIIESSRKDTFVDIAKSYVGAVRTLWTSDNLTCEGATSSAVDDGDYYVLINTKEAAKDRLPVLVDQGGKSSWGNRDVSGYVRVHVETVIDATGEGKRTTKFYVGLTDGTHGIIDDDTLTSDKLQKGNVKMTLSNADLKKVQLSLDDGTLNCTKDTTTGVYACIDVTPIRPITGLCIEDGGVADYVDHIDINTVSFADDDWETISAAAKSGSYPYQVGDTKEVDLGALGKHTVRVANTSTPSECSQANFSQTACGFVIEFADIITTHNMNSTNTNVGGWPATSMRAYLNNEVYNSLPSELRSAIINTNVISGHGSTAGEVNFTSTDKLYLLSTAEVWAQGHTYDTSKDNTRQLDYYANLGVTISNSSGAIKQYYQWWLRAASSATTSIFCYVSSYGGCGYNTAFNTDGAAPAFRIA